MVRLINFERDKVFADKPELEWRCFNIIASIFINTIRQLSLNFNPKVIKLNLYYTLFKFNFHFLYYFKLYKKTNFINKIFR